MYLLNINNVGIYLRFFLWLQVLHLPSDYHGRPDIVKKISISYIKFKFKNTNHY